MLCSALLCSALLCSALRQRRSRQRPSPQFEKKRTEAGDRAGLEYSMEPIVGKTQERKATGSRSTRPCSFFSWFSCVSTSFRRFIFPQYLNDSTRATNFQAESRKNRKKRLSFLPEVLDQYQHTPASFSVRRCSTYGGIFTCVNTSFSINVDLLKWLIYDKIGRQIGAGLRACCSVKTWYYHDAEGMAWAANQPSSLPNPSYFQPLTNRKRDPWKTKLIRTKQRKWPSAYSSGLWLLRSSSSLSEPSASNGHFCSPAGRFLRPVGIYPPLRNLCFLQKRDRDNAASYVAALGRFLSGRQMSWRGKKTI